MKSKRPVNLELTKLKFPPMAIVSILHRISGIILFLLLPVMLYFLDQSLASSRSFANLQDNLSNYWHKLLIFGFCSALIYHGLAGIRHLIMDIGFGESLSTGRRSAWLVLIIAAALIIGLGVWIC